MKRAPRPQLPPLRDEKAARLERFRDTVWLAVRRMHADRDTGIDARLGRGSARYIGGSLSSTDLLGTAIRHEVATAMTDVLTDIFAAITPASLRERSLNAFIETFRAQVAAKSKEAQE